MTRREFIAGLVTAAAWPVKVRAQPKVPVIGFLNAASPREYAHPTTAFLRGLSEIGYLEGQNVTIEYRWAEGQYARLPAMAADLVRRQVAVIVGNTNASLAAKAATTTIPIVFVTPGDPVELGLVASLNRPGGNITGVTNLNVEVAPKRLELLHEAAPAAADIAVLLNPTGRNSESLSRDLQSAGHTLGLQIRVLSASTEREIEAAFKSLEQLRAAALVIGPDPFFNTQAERLAALTVRHALPAIYQYREFAAAGGLLSYGGSITDAYRLVGLYTGRILKNESAADLPVQQSTKVELIINLKTAEALGLTVPQTLLAAADEVIE